MRVLISAPDLTPGKNVSGISSVVDAIITGLEDKVEFIHLKAGRSDLDSSGVKGYFQLIKSLLLFPWIVYRDKIDLFHQNVPLNGKGIIREFLFGTMAKICRIPILVHLHGGLFIDDAPGSRWLYWMTRIVLKRGEQVIVLNDYEKGQLESLYQSESIILKNAIDTHKFLMKESYSQSDLPVLLFLGKIHEEKGLDEMVDAFEMIYPEHSFKFVLCGAGPRESYYVSRFKNILNNDFEFMGVVSGAQKIKVIQQSDYFLLPSYSEGLPIALLENMSCGVIPIVSDDEALLHVITDGENGYVVKKRSALDLAEKLKYIISLSVEQNMRLSRKVRESVEKNYSIDDYNESLLRLYDNVVFG